MKIKYRFVNETVEIEVAEEWGGVLIDLDREEYNSNQKETRRHVPLSKRDKDGTEVFSSSYLEDRRTDVVSEVFRRIDCERLYAALKELEPAQCQLVTDIFFNDIKETDIAQRDGVSKAAVTQRLSRAIKKIRKYLS